MLCMVHLGSCPADERWNTYRISGESFRLRPHHCPATNDICILSQRSQNEKPESCSNLCGRISGNSREKIRPCGNTGADFFGIATVPNIQFHAKNACPCRFLQESAPFAEELFPDSVKMHPIYSKLVEKQWKQP